MNKKEWKKGELTAISIKNKSVQIDDKDWYFLNETAGKYMGNLKKNKVSFGVENNKIFYIKNEIKKDDSLQGEDFTKYVDKPKSKSTPQKMDEKGKQIRRMAILKVAVQMVIQANALGDEEVLSSDVIKIAKELEKWVVE